MHPKLAPAFLLLLLAGCGSQGGTGSIDAGTADATGQDGATQDGNTSPEAGSDGSPGETPPRLASRRRIAPRARCASRTTTACLRPRSRDA